MEAPDYHERAHFETMDEGVLVAALKSTGYFFPFKFPRKCGVVDSVYVWFESTFTWVLQVFGQLVSLTGRMKITRNGMSGGE